jgi:hypothetical protein
VSADRDRLEPILSACLHTPRLKEQPDLHVQMLQLGRGDRRKTGVIPDGTDSGVLQRLSQGDRLAQRSTAGA